MNVRRIVVKTALVCAAALALGALPSSRRWPALTTSRPVPATMARLPG